MPGKRSAVARSLAAVLAMLMLVLAAPPALAADTPNIWKLWVEDLGDREYKVEIPFLVIVSIGPMIAITPIWLAQLAIGAAKGED